MNCKKEIEHRRPNKGNMDLGLGVTVYYDSIFLATLMKWYICSASTNNAVNATQCTPGVLNKCTTTEGSLRTYYPYTFTVGPVQQSRTKMATELLNSLVSPTRLLRAILIRDVSFQ